MPHIHEKIDFAVEVLIVHKNRVLLRLHDKLGIWIGPGGHIELDEDPEQAALREVMEEVGLEVKLVGAREEFRSSEGDILPPVALNRHRINATHEHIAFLYFATSRHDRIDPKNEEDRSDDCRWCTKEDILKMDLLPNTRRRALEALERLGEKE